MQTEIIDIDTNINLVDEWLTSRGLRILNYQKDIIENKIPYSLKTSTLPTVLAACPSAGKTIMSIIFIEKFLKENIDAKVLVLTHGTTVLRSQYAEEIEALKPDFTWSNVEGKKDLINNDSQVIITLPQTLKRTNLARFDLIVIDEAHHFYFADMVQKIIKKSEPKYQLLLTGTPSPFIRKNYPIIPVTVNQLLDYDMVEDVIVELATSTYSFNQKDYNNQLELKDDVKINEEDTITTLDLLLENVVKRLKSVFKNEPVKYAHVTAITGWKIALMELSKTMIACKSQAQAKQVAKYFEKQGIVTALSISDTDIDSNQMRTFKTDKDCLVLIVVARGILGFNYPEMENVIDMTASQNIDRIFQLMARVLRKHPNGKKKMFFKVAPHYLEQYFEFVMTCVLCLTDEEYYTKFNGKNFLDLEIPVVRVKREKQERAPDNHSTNKTKKREIKSIDYLGQPSIRLFKDIIHKNNTILSSYAFVKIKEIKYLLLSERNYWTDEKLKSDAFRFNSKTEWENNSSSACQTARRKGQAFYDECCVHMTEIKRDKWTDEELNADASKYTTKTDWSKNSSGAYTAALNRGKKFMEQCCKHMDVLRHKRSDEELINDAAKYKTRADWEKNSPNTYTVAMNRGVEFYEKCCEHMPKQSNIAWTYDEIINDALKYNKITNWAKSSGAYHAALKRGKEFLEKCCVHMEKKFLWTDDLLLQDALKYNTPGEWTKNNSSAYSTAYKRGKEFYKKCINHMVSGKKIKWTDSVIKDEALKYATKIQWFKESNSSYQIAKRKGKEFFNECIKHMKK